MIEDRIFKAGVKILHYYGRVELVSPVRWGEVYEDQKLIIRACWPFDYMNDSSYFDLYIALKLRPQDDIQQPVFGMVKTDRDTTIVYYWKGIQQFVRPGRWIDYLSYLIRKMDKENEETQKWNNQPVDDQGLFSDMDME